MIIIAPDKFKSSLSSFEVCDAIEKGILSVVKEAEIRSFPMADGGDGFAEVLKHYKGTATITCKTVDPLHREIMASYQWSEKDKIAIIEMATASGLVLLSKEERNPMSASAYGTGIQIKDAVKRGATKIILGLGGSATNDAGTGILSALEFLFEDEKGNRLTACGENLSRICRIVPPAVIPAVRFEIACDVENVLFGEHGAAYVYATQKGADVAMLKQLDEGLQNFALVLKKQFQADVSSIPGTGAAGGIAAGLLPFFNVEIRKGMDLVLNASGIQHAMVNADMLITGEGKIDAQSTQGKVVGRIAEMATANNIPCIAFCGFWEPGIKEVKGLEKIISLAADESAIEAAIQNAAMLLESKVAAYFKTIRG